jgi:hypothetical protein
MMLEGIYYLEPNIMNVINNFHIETEEERRRKQRSIIHDTAIVHTGDQQRIHKVGQSSKAKHVSFEDVANCKAEAEKYVTISEEEVTFELLFYTSLCIYCCR